jgi:hypothetical protein
MFNLFEIMFTLFHLSIEIVTIQEFFNVFKVIVVFKNIISSYPMHMTINLINLDTPMEIKNNVIIGIKIFQKALFYLYIYHILFTTYHQKTEALSFVPCLSFCHNYLFSSKTNDQHTKLNCKYELDNWPMIILMLNYCNRLMKIKYQGNTSKHLVVNPISFR